MSSVFQHKEKANLERVFAHERAEASQRIIDITSLHEKVLAQSMIKLGLTWWPQHVFGIECYDLWLICIQEYFKLHIIIEPQVACMRLVGRMVLKMMASRMRIHMNQKEINIIILIFLSFYTSLSSCFWKWFHLKAEKSIEECYLKNPKEFTIENTVPTINQVIK